MKGADCDTSSSTAQGLGSNVISVGEGAASRPWRRARCRQQPSPLLQVLLPLLALLLLLAAAGSARPLGGAAQGGGGGGPRGGRRAASTAAAAVAFLKPTTRAAASPARRPQWAGLAPQRSRALAAPTAMWGPARGRERKRGQVSALLDPPQRYASQDWLENLSSLLVSRIAKRISGHLLFNTGVCACSGRATIHVGQAYANPYLSHPQCTHPSITNHQPTSVGRPRHDALRAAPGPGGDEHEPHPPPAHVERAGPPPCLQDECSLRPLLGGA